MSRRHDSLAADLLGGAAGGLMGGLAVVALSAGRLAATGATVGEEVAVRRRVEARLGRPHRPEGVRADAPEAAAAYGWRLLLCAITGAGYGLVRRRLPGPPGAGGAVFGLGLAPVAYGLVGPLLGLTAPPWEEAPTVQVRRTLEHLVFGLVTGFVTELAAERVR